MYDLYDMTSLAADEGGAEGGEGAGPSRRPKEGTGGAEVLDTERLAWCTRILNQVSSGTRIPPCAWLWTERGDLHPRMPCRNVRAIRPYHRPPSPLQG